MSRVITGRSNAVPITSTVFTGSSLVTGLTQHQRHVLANHFDAVRIAIPNMSTGSVAGVKVAFGTSTALGAYSAVPAGNSSSGTTSAAPTPTEVVSSALNNFRLALFAGQASGTLPAAIDAANSYPSWTWTDWTQVASVNRTDGGAGSILDLRIFIPVAAGSITSAYTGGTNDSWAIWGREDLITGGRVMRVWNQDVDGVSSPASFTSATTRPNFVPCIVQYMSRTTGQTLLVIGDSIAEASIGGTYTGNSSAWRAAKACKTPTEVVHMTLPGGTSIQTTNRALPLLDELEVTHILSNTASVNNFGTTLGARVSGESGGTIGMLTNAARRNGARLGMYGFLPVANAAKGYGATDSHRVTANALARARAEQLGVTWLDLVGLFSGSTHASGQIEPNAAIANADGIHPNDAGYTAFIAPIAAFIG